MPNIQDALNEASRMAFDESIGYTFGGDGNPDSNGYDCSAFVIRCLYRAGFNVPSSRVGTAYMRQYLINAGFQIIPVNTGNEPLEHGDILVMNHLDGSGGHTTFYAEKMLGFTDAGADSPNTGIVPRLKIEASSSRGHTAQGDSRKNGSGAYWEVWAHAFYDPWYSGYTPGDPNDEIYIARYGTKDKDAFGLMAYKLLFRSHAHKMFRANGGGGF